MNFKSTNIGIMSPVNQNSITPRMSGTARRTHTLMLSGNCISALDNCKLSNVPSGIANAAQRWWHWR